MTTWTNKQVAKLREHYPSMPRAELLALFAPHPWGSIVKMAFNHGIRRRRPFTKWRDVCAAHVMQTRYFDGVER